MEVEPSGSEIGRRSSGANGTNRFEIGKVTLDHVHDVDVVENLDAGLRCFRQEVRRQLVFRDEHELVDVLSAIDRSLGLQSAGVQPAHVQRQQRRKLVEREPRLSGRRQEISHEVDRLVGVVNGTRRNGIKPSRLATDDYCGDDKNTHRRRGDENAGDQMPIR